MKRIFLAIALLLCFTAAEAKLWNWVVATVGKESITDWDLKRMSQFLVLSGEGHQTNDTKEAFKTLLMTYSLLDVIAKEPKAKLSDKEINDYIASVTNVTNASDSAAEFRMKLFIDYPEQFRLAIKKDQVVRAISYYNEALKTNAGLQVTESELKKFYDENKEKFIDYPSLDLIVFALDRPKNLGLDDLEKFESSLSNIAETLKRTDDPAKLLERYKDELKFEPYSGRTGFKPVQELLTNIPEEVLSISLMEKLTLPPNKVVMMTKGTVFGPQLIPIRKLNGKPLYVILKIVDKKTSQPIAFEKVKEMIERKLRGDRMQQVLEGFIREKIKKNEVTVNLLDKSWEGYYNEFLRR